MVEALIQEKNKLTHFASNRELHFKFKTLLDFQTVKSHLHYRKIGNCVLILERRKNESLSSPSVQLQNAFSCLKVYERVVSMEIEAIPWSNKTRFFHGIQENTNIET